MNPDSMISEDDFSINLDKISNLKEEMKTEIENNFRFSSDDFKSTSFGDLETIIIEDGKLKKVIWISKEPCCISLTKGSSLNLSLKEKDLFKGTMSSGCYSLTSTVNGYDNSTFEITLCCSVT
jgi:hypothetical protein